MFLRLESDGEEQEKIEATSNKIISEFAIPYILHLAVETAAIQTKPAYAGYKTPDFPLVRVGGLGMQ